MEPIDYFMDTAYLEPKCLGCNGKVEYGVTTKWDDAKSAHKCVKCGLHIA